MMQGYMLKSNRGNRVGRIHATFLKKVDDSEVETGNPVKLVVSGSIRFFQKILDHKVQQNDKNGSDERWF